MSDTSLAIAQSYAASQTVATRQSLQTEIVRQQADSERSVVTLLEQSAAEAKAALPSGQGQIVDIRA